MTDRTRVHMIPASGKAADVFAAARRDRPLALPGRWRRARRRPRDRDPRGSHRRAVRERDATSVTALMVAATRVPETVRLRPLLVELRGLGLQMRRRRRRVRRHRRRRRRSRTSSRSSSARSPTSTTDAGAGRPHRGRLLGCCRASCGPTSSRRRTGLQVPDRRALRDLGGFVMSELGRIPGSATRSTADGVRLPVDAWTAAASTGSRVSEARRARRGGRLDERRTRLSSLVGLLLAANAFFVGAEFAIISARRSSIEPLAARGRPPGQDGAVGDGARVAHARVRPAGHHGLLDEPRRGRRAGDRAPHRRPARVVGREPSS